MKNKTYTLALLLLTTSIFSTGTHAFEWKLGDIKSQECLKDSKLINSNIKYCHNCRNDQGNLTSWTFHTTCNGVVQRRLVQSKLNCNSTAGHKNETDQKEEHIKKARELLPPSTQACKQLHVSDE
jgi:hypothetical protein